MRTVVIYQSKAGYTRTYAQWIAEELGADLIPLARLKSSDLGRYDLIIFGGGLYVGGIIGVKKILGMLKALPDKHIFIFTTGLSPARPEVLQEIENRNFSPSQMAVVKFYYLRGGFDVRRLSAIDQLLMNIMKRMLRRKKHLTPDDRGMLAAFEQPLDFTNKEALAGLIADARALRADAHDAH